LASSRLILGPSSQFISKIYYRAGLGNLNKAISGVSA
jgi:hypothetical protein